MSCIIRIDPHSFIALPREALDALGLSAGAELDVEIVGRALIIRSADEARRSRDFMTAFDFILNKGRTTYEELAEDPNR